MEQEHTPVRTTPEKTLFRFTQSEIREALLDWLVKHSVEVPAGKVSANPWAATLFIAHPNPPPARKDVGDE